jgi:pilus assembly protein CpaE
MTKILVIDDDAEFLEMIRLLLEREGYQAILSADALDGLAKALANPPDLAIIDVMMPGVTGYEICRKLRASTPTASIPIIILTARGQTVDRQAALDSGADEHMTKPVPMAELRDRINELVAKGTSARTQPSFRGTLGLLSLRGGVGVTTLAVNLAATLAQAGGEICLVDLCPSSGHVALQLGLRPEPNWSGLVKVGSLSAEAVESHLLQHGSGLRVLASPVFPVVGQGLPRATAQATLKVLQQRFPVVVVDMPSTLDEAAMATLEAATLVALVVTAEAPSIQATVGTLRALQGAAKFQIVLNQVAPGEQLPAGAIERALKYPVQATLPFDPAQAQALAHRTPLVFQNPASPLAQAVQGLVQNLAAGQ